MTTWRSALLPLRSSSCGGFYMYGYPPDTQRTSPTAPRPNQRRAEDVDTWTGLARLARGLARSLGATECAYLHRVPGAGLQTDRQGDRNLQSARSANRIRNHQILLLSSRKSCCRPCSSPAYLHQLTADFELVRPHPPAWTRISGPTHHLTRRTDPEPVALFRPRFRGWVAPR
jgi:hypothetical protein